jgi:hypothetical protein
MVQVLDHFKLLYKILLKTGNKLKKLKLPIHSN